jgi:hypothetical protein
MGEPGTEVAGRVLGPENVEQAREYLEQLDPELHRYIMDFVYGEVYAGFPTAWNALSTMVWALEDRQAPASREESDR